MNQNEAREDHRARFRQAMQKHGQALEKLNVSTEHLEQHRFMIKRLHRMDGELRDVGIAVNVITISMLLFSLTVFVKLFL